MKIPQCSGPTDRRTFLKIGGFGMGALGLGMEPGLAQILQAAETRAAVDEDRLILRHSI